MLNAIEDHLFKVHGVDDDGEIGVRSEEDGSSSSEESSEARLMNQVTAKMK
jgi:hypothetical protein